MPNIEQSRDHHVTLIPASDWLYIVHVTQILVSDWLVEYGGIEQSRDHHVT